MSHEPGRERHMTYRCEKCKRSGRSGEFIHIEDFDEYWCQSCADNEAETAYDRHQQDLMENGPGPTLAEQQAEAEKVEIMPTISEPLTERHEWTYRRCREAFIRGEIGPNTFIVSLQLMGLSQRDAESEVALARMERRK